MFASASSSAALAESLPSVADSKGSAHRAEETAHLGNIWHNLTVFHRCLKLPQKRVAFTIALIESEPSMLT
jgi:hypothetical protein